MAIPKEQKRKAKRKAKQKQRISIQATTLVKAKANNFYQEALWYYREENFDESLTNIKAALQYTPNGEPVGEAPLKEEKAESILPEPAVSLTIASDAFQKAIVSDKFSSPDKYKLALE